MEVEETGDRIKGLLGRVKVGCIDMKPTLGTWLTARLSQWLICGSKLFSNLIYTLDDDTVCTLKKIEDSNNIGWVLDLTSWR